MLSRRVPRIVVGDGFSTELLSSIASRTVRRQSRVSSSSSFLLSGTDDRRFVASFSSSSRLRRPGRSSLAVLDKTIRFDPSLRRSKSASETTSVSVWRTTSSTSRPFYLDSDDDSELASLAERVDRLAPDDPRLADALRAVGARHWEAGRLRAARAAHEDALRAVLSASPVRDEDVGTLAHALGTIHARLANDDDDDEGDAEEARRWYAKALDVKERAFGPEHPETAKTLNGAAALCLSRRRATSSAHPDPPRAIDLLTRAERIFRNDPSIGHDHPYVATVCENLGRAYRLSGPSHAERAASEYAEALRIRKLHGDGARALADMHTTIGDCYFGAKELEKAMDSYQAGLALITQRRISGGETDNDGENNKETEEGDDDALVLRAALHHNLGLTLSKMGQLKAALANLEESLRLKRKILVGRGEDEDHFEIADSLNCMGAVYATKGEYHRASSFFRESLRTLDSSLRKAKQRDDDDADATDRHEIEEVRRSIEVNLNMVTNNMRQSTGF